MKKISLVLTALAVAASCLGGQTSKLVATRSKASAEVVPGKWHASFSKCKKYAVDNKVPLIAVWSNGDNCGHCVAFESSCNSSYFKNWMKTSGCVFYFIHSGDGGDGKIASSVFHWIRKNKNTAYPFVRIYWPAGKVDVATVGDKVDGNKDGTKGGKKAVAYFKSKLKKFNPKPVDPNLPYTIDFAANFPSETGGQGEKPDATNVLYSTSVTLPANPFSYTNFIFSGWAKSATGSVAYSNGATVKGLTSTSNATVTLHARWTRSVYGPYYTGVQKTIKVVNYAGTVYSGWKTSSKIPGLKWSTKGYWKGKPTKAGTYTVKFTKKGSTAFTRTFIIKTDAVEVADITESILATDTSAKFANAISAVSGSLTNIKVTGLPEGLVFMESTGTIEGRVKTPGSYKITISGTTVNKQTVKKTITLEVEEGNAILLNGLAHADEVWAFTGDEVNYSVALKVKHPAEEDEGEDWYEIVKATEDNLTLSAVDAAGNPVSADVLKFEEGKIVGLFEEDGIYTVTLTMTDDEGGESELTFTINCLGGTGEPE